MDGCINNNFIIQKLMFLFQTNMRRYMRRWLLYESCISCRIKPLGNIYPGYASGPSWNFSVVNLFSQNC
jgi:hypothetical protein